jgi:hypothetical protein
MQPEGAGPPRKPAPQTREVQNLFLGLAQKQKPGKKAEFQHNDLGFSRPVFA